MSASLPPELIHKFSEGFQALADDVVVISETGVAGDQAGRCVAGCGLRVGDGTTCIRGQVFCAPNGTRTTHHGDRLRRYRQNPAPRKPPASVIMLLAPASTCWGSIRLCALRSK